MCYLQVDGRTLTIQGPMHNVVNRIQVCIFEFLQEEGEEW
jgi:hypothetical protein